MRRSLPGINYALAAAVHRLAERYWHLPRDQRPDVTGEHWNALEAELDMRCGAGDEDGALRAISEWEQRTHRVLEQVAA